ncbi:MAG: EF-hand domain-containing protein 1, partial [Paramarteilia canceri]
CFTDDKTIEIRESFILNSGYEPFPIFLRRQKVFFQGANKSQNDNEMQRDLIEWFHISQGKLININGHLFLILEGSDTFSSEMLKKNSCNDISNKEILEKVNMKSDSSNRKLFVPPPHFGPGDPADSLQNCLNLRPVAPKKDFVKLLERQNCTLDFMALMLSTYVTNEANTSIGGDWELFYRPMVIRIHLEDDSMSVIDYNWISNDNGVKPKLFLQRYKAYVNPENTAKSVNLIPNQPVQLTLEDLLLPGKIVGICGRSFKIVGCNQTFLKKELEIRKYASNEEIDKLIEEFENYQKNTISEAKSKNTEKEIEKHDRRIKIICQKLSDLIQNSEERLKEILGVLGNENILKKEDFPLLMETIIFKYQSDPEFINCLWQKITGSDSENSVTSKTILDFIQKMNS